MDVLKFFTVRLCPSAMHLTVRRRRGKYMVENLVLRRRRVSKHLSVYVFCLFALILYVPSTIFQLNRDGSSWV